MLVLDAWGKRASSFWTTNKTNTFLDKAEPSSRASKTSFSASSCIADEEKLGGGCRDTAIDSKKWGKRARESNTGTMERDIQQVNMHMHIIFYSERTKDKQ